MLELVIMHNMNQKAQLSEGLPHVSCQSCTNLALIYVFCSYHITYLGRKDIPVVLCTPLTAQAFKQVRQ